MNAGAYASYQPPVGHFRANFDPGTLANPHNMRLSPPGTRIQGQPKAAVPSVPSPHRPGSLPKPTNPPTLRPPEAILTAELHRLLKNESNDQVRVLCTPEQLEQLEKQVKEQYAGEWEKLR